MKVQKIKSDLHDLLRSPETCANHEINNIATALAFLEDARNYSDEVDAGTCIKCFYDKTDNVFRLGLVVEPCNENTKKLLQKYVKLVNKLNG